MTKLIVALDFEEQDKALRLLQHLDPRSCAVKVGSEMFTRFGPVFVEYLVKQNYQVFLDLKFHDIPNTVAKACQAAAGLGVWMINLHASGGIKMMETARQALDAFGNKRPLLIAVTVLTSMNSKDLFELGLSSSLEKQVQHLTGLTQKAGLDGVVCSAYEVPLVKNKCGSDFLTVTPGIRLTDDKIHDQVRVMTPDLAKEQGTDFIVVGRPITHAEQPAEVVQEILHLIS